ncbi:MAG TPA: hypothetical protein VFN19_10020, partial [Candidatus Nanopelagicales bacterium]|nr:hypothetical protein [Candidatus Nanopelagicales bacterium]
WAGVVNHRAVPAGTFGTAMSYEGAVDETTFVLGPALVGLVVAAYAAPAAMLLAAGLTVVFATAFALHPTALLVGHHEAVRDAVPRRADLLSLWLLTGMMFCIGLFFASVQTGVTAIAIAAGSEGSAGLVYGAMGITSAIAGLLTAALPPRFTYPTRLVVFPAVLLLCVVPLLVLGASGSSSLGLLTAAVVLAGAAVAPTLITGFYLGERAVPLSRVSWAMTVMASGVVLGYAAAALLAGLLADAHGSIGAFGVTFCGVAVAVALAAAGHRRYTRLLAGTEELSSR